MGFVAPIMLWGAAAAAVPIALHFFFRSRYRRVPWAAMKFLLTSIEQTSRRLKFQELLLLAARVAVLVVLALALARPTSTAGTAGGPGEAVDAVLVIDTSYSMGVREAGKTRLELAKEAARDVIDHLPPHSTVHVIASADRATLLGPAAPADLDRAAEVIDVIRLSHLATDFLPGVTAAAEILEHAQTPNKELYFFSDMQKLGWDAQSKDLKTRLDALHQHAAVYLVRCGQQTPHNVAVVGIVPQSGIAHTGERASFAVLVRNTGGEAVRNLTVSLTVDGDASQREAQPISELAPGQTQAVTLTAKLTSAGLRVLTAIVKPDELEADNRFDQVIRVREQVRLLVIDGALNEQQPEKSASFYLMHALSPVRDEDRPGYYVQPRLIAPQQAVPALLADKDVCVLVNVDLAPSAGERTGRVPHGFLDALSRFVRSGHGLVIFAGDRVAAGLYNKALFDQQNLLPIKLKAARTELAPESVRLDRTSADAPFFRVLAEDDQYKGLNAIGIHGYLETEQVRNSPAHALLRFNNAQPAVVSRKVEAGEVLLVTTTADLSWTDWPLARGMYLPFIDLLLNHLLHGQAALHNLTAGSPLHWEPVERDAGQAFVCVRADGTREHLGRPRNAGGRALLTVPDTATAGIYRIVADTSSERPSNRRPSDTGVPFAVVPDLRESEDLQCLSDNQIDQRLGFHPVHRVAGRDIQEFTGSERYNREWTMWLLAGVLGLALAESGLAWLCGRPW